MARKLKRAAKAPTSPPDTGIELLRLEDQINGIRGEAMVIRLAVVGLINGLSCEAIAGLDALISRHVGELRQVAAEIGRVRGYLQQTLSKGGAS
jgi:hypothetical protein